MKGQKRMATEQAEQREQRDKAEQAKDAQQGLTRRGFFTGAALGAAALASGALLSACDSKPQSANGVTDATDITWDEEADVVVVGSGTALAAGVAAVSKGASVIVLEKAMTVGGSTVISGGGSWIPNTRYSQEFGDSREKALTYVTHMAGGQSTDAIIAAFVDRGGEIVDLLADNTTIEWQIGQVFGDYHPEWEGGLQFGRGHSPKRDEGEPGAGYPIISRLQKAIEDAGGTIRTNTPVRRLITRTGDNGVPEVLGVEAWEGDSESKKLYVKANKGVLLGCGGFEWDEELKTHFLRGKVQFNVSAAGNDGDALRMSMALGSDLRNMNECWGHSCYIAPNLSTLETRTPATIGLMYDRAKPGSILVNKNGERYCNESCDYDTYWRAQLSWDSWGETGYASIPSYFIVDQLFVDRYGLNQIDLVTGASGPGLVDEAAYKADTIEALAGQIGVPSAALAATVTRFNENARQGIDPDFHRGESYYDRVFMSDMGEYFEWGAIEATLGAIEVPPFYAMECSTGTLGTCGGPRVNENSQVIHVTGEVISRLYCSGNASSIGGPGMGYGGAGGTLGPGIVFAGIAGLHAADLSNWA
jgi:succinate dehydrogenase/fumarate reductase flavoprotein subunit